MVPFKSGFSSGSRTLPRFERLVAWLVARTQASTTATQAAPLGTILPVVKPGPRQGGTLLPPRPPGSRVRSASRVSKNFFLASFLRIGFWVARFQKSGEAERTHTMDEPTATEQYFRKKAAMKRQFDISMNPFSISALLADDGGVPACDVRPDAAVSHCSHQHSSPATVARSSPPPMRHTHTHTHTHIHTHLYLHS